jgi:hypothetical protein
MLHAINGVGMQQEINGVGMQQVIEATEPPLGKRACASSSRLLT